jgi:hypothetical protein
VRHYGRTPKNRRIAGVMNKTESEYAMILEGMRRGGGIESYEYEKVTLKIAADCRLTPDFLVINNIGEVEFHEVKGGLIREDAAVKLKVAAASFPFRFKLAQKKGKNWTITEVKA